MGKRCFRGLLIFSIALMSACVSDGTVAPPPPSHASAAAPREAVMPAGANQKTESSAPRRPEWIDNASLFPQDENDYFSGISGSFASEPAAKDDAYHNALTQAVRTVGIDVEDQSVKQMISNQRAGEVVNAAVSQNTLVSQTAKALISGSHLIQSYWEKTVSLAANGRPLESAWKYFVYIQIPKKNIAEAREMMKRKEQEKEYRAKLKDAVDKAAKAQMADSPLRLKERIALMDEAISGIKALDFSRLTGESQKEYLAKFGEQGKKLEDELSRRRKTSVIVVTGHPVNMDGVMAEKITDKAVDSLGAHLAPAQRMLTKCVSHDACMKEAENGEYGRLVALRTDTSTKNGAMGGITATLMIEVTVYDVDSGSAQPPVTVSAQVIAWDGENIPWDVALEKALKNEKLAALAGHSQMKAGK